MFTEAERVKIRRYLGFSALYLQINPRLESAISTVQSQADGGAYPTSDTETDIRSLLADLAALELSFKNLWGQLQILGGEDGLKLHGAAALSALRAEGRRLVGALSDYLSISPVRDVFSAKRSNPYGDSRTPGQP